MKVLDCIGRSNRGREVQNFATEYTFLQGTFKNESANFVQWECIGWLVCISDTVVSLASLQSLKNQKTSLEFNSLLYREPVQRFKNRFDVLMLESPSESSSNSSNQLTLTVVHSIVLTRLGFKNALTSRWGTVWSVTTNMNFCKHADGCSKKQKFFQLKSQICRG